MTRPRLYPVIDGTKECSQCHVVKALDEFPKNAKASDGHQPECKECHNKRSQPIYPRDPGIGEKTCTQCRATKDATEFYDNPYNKTGMDSFCKDCRKTSNADWNRSNPEKRKPIANRWAKKTREDPDKRPAIYAKTRQWQLNNPEAVKKHGARDRAKAKENPVRMEKKRQGTMQFFADRPGYRAAASHKRRALIRQSTIVDAMINVWVLYDRSHGMCTLCNEPVHRETKWPDKRLATIDHAIPSTLGGEHSYANTKLAHHYCNGIKNNRLETPEILAECRRRFLKRYGTLEQVPEETIALPQDQLQLL